MRSVAAMRSEKATTGRPSARMSATDFGAASASRRRVSASTSSTMALITRRTASWISRAWSMPGYFWRHQRRTSRRPAAGPRRSATVEQAGAQAVVDVVVVVGDVVARAPRPAPRARHGRRARDRGRWQYSTMAAGRSVERAAAVEQRAVVLDHAFQRLPGEVEAVELGVALLELGQDAQGLGVVVEAAVGPPCGVAAPPRRHGRTACGRDRGRAPPPRPRSSSRPQRRGRSCARSAPPRASGSAACGSDRPRDRRRPGSCASAGGTPSNG